MLALKCICHFIFFKTVHTFNVYLHCFNSDYQIQVFQLNCWVSDDNSEYVQA